MTSRIDWLENMFITTLKIWIMTNNHKRWFSCYEIINIIHSAIDDTKRITFFLFYVNSFPFRSIQSDTLTDVVVWSYSIFFSLMSIREVKELIQVQSYIFNWDVSIILSLQRKSHRSYIRRRRLKDKTFQQSWIGRRRPSRPSIEIDENRY